MPLQSINPAENKLIAEYKEMSNQEVESIIEESNKAFNSWKNLSFENRAIYLLKAAGLLRERKNELAELMTKEMGKPVNQAKAEVDKCAWACEYYAEHGEGFLKDEYVETGNTKSFVTYNPLGVILAVMPWNFPFWQVFRFAVPALLAGNTGLLKHSSNVTGCAIAIEKIFSDAGFPDYVFKTLLLSSKNVEPVIKNRHVKAVSLTGSVPAGRSIAKMAGEVLKKCVLELGGSDPYLILEDADVDAAVNICATARMVNNGQSCIAAKRFIVVESLYNEFTEKFVKRLEEEKMGDPFDPTVTLGPQAREDLRNELHEQVVESINKGAKLLLGGFIPVSEGAFYPATVLADVEKGMPAYDDELFGPVAAVIKAADEAEAIEIANDSIFGLGAAVFTQNRRRGEEIAAKKLNAGCCFVNDYVKSDPRLPFGGINESGYGRELSHFGIKEFVNIKTVVIA